MTAAVRVYEPGGRPVLPARDYLGAFWRYRHFLVALVRSQRRATQTATLLGPLWSVLDPLLLAGVYFVLLGLLRGGAFGGSDQLALILGGIFLFTFTRESLTGGVRSILRNGKLLMNTTMPRALLPTAAVLQALLALAPGLALYAVLHVALGRPLGRGLVLFPLLLAIHTLFNLGIALLLAVAGALAPDIQNAIGYVLRIWLYVTPVLYAAESLRPGLEPFLAWNPLFPLFAAYQSVLAGGTPGWDRIGIASVWAVVALTAGAVVFFLKERTLALRL